MLVAMREIQVPLLAVLLIGASAAKTRHAPWTRPGPGPAAVFPLWLRRPAAIALCGTEFVLGVGLIEPIQRA